MEESQPAAAAGEFQSADDVTPLSDTELGATGAGSDFGTIQSTLLLAQQAVGRSDSVASVESKAGELLDGQRILSAPLPSARAAAGASEATPEHLAATEVFAGQSTDVTLRPAELPEPALDDAVVRTPRATRGMPRDTLAGTAGETGRAAQGDEDRVRKLGEQLFARVDSMSETTRATPLLPLVNRAEMERDKPLKHTGKVFTEGLESTAGASVFSNPALNVQATGAAATTGTPPEYLVAQQVTYWATNDVKNAELRVEGLGAEQVNVHISIQGNEAQVVFRTDEAVARDVLERTGGYLKDLMSREGLSLTGFSFGAAPQKRHGDGAPDQQQEGRMARKPVMATLPVSLSARSQHVAAQAAHALDVFV